MGSGNHRWTCGECGDSYEASGWSGDYEVNKWARRHKEDHRVAAMSVDERREYWRKQAEAEARVWEFEAAARAD